MRYAELEKAVEKLTSKSKKESKENKKRKYYKRSRILMQLHLNKKLEVWEIVHHINGNRTEDRIENLEIMDRGIHTSHHHAGKRRTASITETF